MQSAKPNVGQRLASMLLDHFFMTLICTVPMVLFVLSTGAFENGEPDSFTSFAFLLVFAVYMAKDSFNGKSIAKRILKLQVVREGTLDPASPARCFVRNLLIPIWPIEVLVTFGDPSRRLGDRLAGTRVLSDTYIRHLRRAKLVEAIGTPEDVLH